MPSFNVLQTLGPHLYQTCPSSNYYDCKAMAIGARSQVGESGVVNSSEVDLLDIAHVA